MYDVAKAILDDRRRIAHSERAAHRAARTRQGEGRRGHLPSQCRRSGDITPDNSSFSQETGR